MSERQTHNRKCLGALRGGKAGLGIVTRCGCALVEMALFLSYAGSLFFDTKANTSQHARRLTDGDADPLVTPQAPRSSASPSTWFRSLSRARL